MDWLTIFVNGVTGSVVISTIRLQIENLHDIERA